MQKIIGMLTNFLWNIRFTFGDGARHKQFWKEERSTFNSNDKVTNPAYNFLPFNIHHKR